MMECRECSDEYKKDGTCLDCYEETNREIDELKSKIKFLRVIYDGPNLGTVGSTTAPPCLSKIVYLVASGSDSSLSRCIPIHRDVLTSRSPVLKAMMKNEMKESLSGIINISDASYDVLRAFVKYMYTAEANLDEHMACDLLALAEKYQVEHLKTYCEKYLMDDEDNIRAKSLAYYVFAQRHGAEDLLDLAMSMIIDDINADKLTKCEEYRELVDKDPRRMIEIYEAYAKQKNVK